MIEQLKGNSILIISHIADIDGMGSIILGMKFYKDIDYILCDIKDLPSVLTRDFSQYEIVYICDLSITQNSVNAISENPSIEGKIKHFDHHPVLLSDIPSYVNSVSEVNGIKTCGTQRFYNYLCSLSHKLDTPFYQEFVEGVRSNDTWDKNGNFQLGSILATIHHLIGCIPFIEMILSMDDSRDFQVPKMYLDLVNSDDALKNEYVKVEDTHLVVSDYLNYKMGIVICEGYRSYVGNELCIQHPELDFVLLINFHRMSCSLRSNKDTLSCGEIAHSFHPEGGGHPKAAGFSIDKESLPKLKPYIDFYLSRIQ